MVNRLVSVGDDFTLPAAVKTTDANLPTRLGATALNATYAPAAGSPSYAAKADVLNLPVSSPALARFKAALAGRDAGPVTVVTAGSSTTAGQKASTLDKGYVNLLAAYTQRAYPLTSGAASPAVRTLAAANTTPPSAPGVQFVNAGWPGAKSNDYLDPTLRTYIGNVNPHMVIHMIGSNDYATGRTPAQYKASLEIVLADLRAKITKPCVHVLVHSYARGDATAEAGHVAPDTEFRQVLIELAAASPADTVFVDLSTEYAAVGIPGTDPLVMLDIDGVHQNDKGHAFMADLLRAKLGIPLALPSAAITTVTKGILTSDTFNRADLTTLNGSMTDCLFGGTPTPWISTIANTFALTGNKVVRGSDANAASLLVNVAHGNARMRWRVLASPTVSSRFVFLRNTSGSTYIAYRLTFDTTGHVKLDKHVSGTTTDLTGYTTTALVSGDVVDMYRNGSSLAVTINGTTVLTATDSTITSGNYAGFSAGSPTNFEFDDFLLEAL